MYCHICVRVYVHRHGLDGSRGALAREFCVLYCSIDANREDESGWTLQGDFLFCSVLHCGI